MSTQQAKSSRFKRMGLVSRMTLITALLLFGTAAGGGAAAYLVANATIAAEIQFAGMSLAHSLAGSIVTVINKPGAEGELQVALNKLLEIDSDERIRDAYVVSKDLIVLAAKDPKHAGDVFTQFAGLQAVEQILTVRQPGFGTSIAAPVQWGKNNKRTLGHVVLFISENAFTAARDRMIALFSIVFLIAVVASIWVTRLVLRKTLHPIVALGIAANELANGNSEYPLPAPSGDDEIGSATKSFLAMREAQRIFVRFSNPALVRRIMEGRAPDHPEEVKLSIGFGDGVGFTNWSTAHTATEISTMLTDYFTLFGQLVEQNDGIIEKFIGDAVMSYYGLQTDRATQRMARASLRTHLYGQIVFHIANRAFKRYHKRLPLQFRFGIATGKCVVGPMGARGVKQDYTLIGSTVNLASRLEGAAKPGGLAIDNFTFQNAGGDEFLIVEPPRLETIKGFAAKVPVYQVLGLRDPKEQEKMHAFLRRFFTWQSVRDVLRLSPEQQTAFEQELDVLLMGPALQLPTPPLD